jgi:hypothetical protein
MKEVVINLNVNSIASVDYSNDRATPRVNVFREPYTLPVDHVYLVDDNNKPCLDITSPGLYTYSFNINEAEGERCGVDIFSVLANDVYIVSDIIPVKKLFGTIKQHQISIRKGGIYNITIDIL